MEEEEQINQMWSDPDWLARNNIVELDEKSALEYFMTSPYYNAKNTEHEKGIKDKRIIYKYKINSIKNGIINVEKLHVEAGRKDVLEAYYMVASQGYAIFKANNLAEIYRTYITHINLEVKELLK